jgi:hypothetical protein
MFLDGCGGLCAPFRSPGRRLAGRGEGGPAGFSEPAQRDKWDHSVAGGGALSSGDVRRDAGADAAEVQGWVGESRAWPWGIEKG